MKRQFGFPVAHSLRNRLVLALIIIVFIPLMLLGGISYVAIQEIYSNKVESGIMNTVDKVKAGLESTLDNMEYASLQLSMEGSVGQNLYNLLSTPSHFQQYALRQEIQKNLNLLNFTNPYLGVILYFSDDGKIMFNNLEVRERLIDPSSKLLSKVNGVTFYGPQTTAYRYGDHEVFALTRPVEFPGSPAVSYYVYIETNVRLFEKLLSREQYGMKVAHVLRNQAGEVIFSDLKEVFPPGTNAASERGENGKGNEGYNFYKVTSDQGWSLSAVIDKTEFNKEFYNWAAKFFAVLVSGIAVSVVIAYFIWRSFYRPLKKIGNEVLHADVLQADKPIALTRIRELDILVRKINQMTDRIQTLFREMEQRERVKQQLEVEKLLYQINPHFIHNTLNSIQFMARMNGQQEIDRMVSIFTRVLHYNLDKRGETVEVGEELNALRDYIELQQIRYDYEFEVRFTVDEEVAASGMTIPKFILQPLVENALYHGLDNDRGAIDVTLAKEADEHLVIHVMDNGSGMTEEEIGRLLSEEPDRRRKTGLGIGFRYVRRMLAARYGNHCDFEIASKPGEGTDIMIRIPIRTSDHS
ncbi:sensor histidine kinase [Paenibacillus sp. GCM10027626]|uniref:sensor histidine kinase n=1 Tax=Paenibacillus sp. GCM10027626 TaxID=3273411 RepID=UPI0036293405